MCSDDKTVRLWSLDGRLFQIFHQDPVITPITPITPIAFDGNTILTIKRDEANGDDEPARLWRISGDLLKTFQGCENLPSIVMFFSPDDNFILLICHKSAKLRSIDGKLFQPFYYKKISRVSFASDRKYMFDISVSDSKYILASSSDFLGEKNTTKLWRINGIFSRTLQQHPSFIPFQKQLFIPSVAFAPDGKSILTGSDDKTAWLFYSNGSKFTHSKLTGSNDTTAKLWDISGNLLRTFQGHQSSVISVAFSPDGKSILTGSDDKTAKLWDIEPDRAITAICNHLNDFASLSNNRNIPEKDRNIRQRAKTACEGIPPPS